MPYEPASISVVIPVYNSEGTIRRLTEELLSVHRGSDTNLEIILVEDGSRDKSAEIVRQLSNENEQVRCAVLMRNYGQHNALLAGIRRATNDIIVTIDDDLQNPPSEIKVLLDKLSEGYDVVYGRPLRDRHGFLRNLASALTKLALSSNLGVEVARDVSAFRAFRTILRKGFDSYSDPSVSIDVLLSWTTDRFAAVDVKHEPRKAGQSNYTIGMLVRHAMNLMTGFSTLPLQLASVVGFCTVVFGLGTLTYVLVRYFIGGGTVPGFTFIASIVSIFSGAQLFAIGLFGEYLARIHFRSMDKPAYVIRYESSDNDGG